MTHLSLVPKQEMTDGLSLSNQSYQDEQGIDDQVSNNDACEDTNLVFISPANQDLGFEFEDVQPLELETTAEVEEEEQKKVLFTTREEEESQLTTVNVDASSSILSRPSRGTNYEPNMNLRTRSQKKQIAYSSRSATNDEKCLQSEPTTRSASSSSKRPNKGVQKHKSFQCSWPECNAKLSTAKTLTRHERIHTGVKPYVCDWPDCKQRFTQSTHLTGHKRIHTGEKPFICDWPDCGRRFADDSNLRAHRKSHHTAKKQFKKFKDQNYHKEESILNGENSFTCDWPGCNTKLSSSRGLARHKLIHGEKPYICDWEECGQRFTYRYSLTRHKRTHTGEKLYICNWEDCKQRFTAHNSLARHKQAHTGEKSYICDFPDCGRSYTTQNSLNGHKRDHKPYVCDWRDCNGPQRFTNRKTLSKHKRTHTNIAEQCEQDIVKVELDPFELNAE